MTGLFQGGYQRGGKRHAKVVIQIFFSTCPNRRVESFPGWVELPRIGLDLRDPHKSQDPRQYPSIFGKRKFLFFL